MRAMTEIKNLQEKNPLFREFCKINGLKDGDYYSAVDYIEYCDGCKNSEGCDWKPIKPPYTGCVKRKI